MDHSLPKTSATSGAQRRGGARSLPGWRLRPRWKKTLGDLWSNKTRTLLVVCAIFIGVFAVGMIVHSQIILSQQLQATYESTQPAHIEVSIGATGYNSDFTMNSAPENLTGFDEDLVAAIAHMPEVADAEGRRNFSAQVYVGGMKGWQSIQLIAIDDYEDMRVNQVEQVRGAWPPPDKHVLLERSSLPALAATSSESILVELSNGKKRRRLPVAGAVHDLHQWPTPFIGTIYGYVTMDTLEWFGEPREFNELNIRVAGHADSREHNQQVAQMVYDKIQKAGLEPAFPHVPEPGEPPLEFLITAITALMSTMSVLALLLSGFLVVNTISALLAQQVAQIGIMKAVGARSAQIIGMYLVLVACFGLLALVFAVPLAALATRLFTDALAGFLNFDVHHAGIPWLVLATQAAMSICVPVLAALWPVISGTRVTIREALSAQGGSSSYGRGLLDRLMQRVRGLPRPVLLSLRNTFRRKGRLALTLVTLTLGGAVFISVFSVKNSLLSTMEDYVHRLYSFDAEITLERTYLADYLVSEARQVPGIVAAEPQVQTSVRRVFPGQGDREGQNIQMFAVPPDTVTMNPRLQAGRWLLPDDENALVVSTGLLQDDPDIGIGSEITLKIKDRETTWRVVGIMPTIGEMRWVYASYAYYGRVAKEVGQASYIRIVTRQHTPAAQAAAADALVEHYKSLGIRVGSSRTMAELSEADMESIAVIIGSLLFMAVLVAAVGGLGLAGTMSLNVIERVREVGIMRAIGAADSAVLQIFLVEGVMIGLLSWAIGGLLALPLSKAMSDSMGLLLFAAPLSFRFSPDGILIWLLISVLVAAAASFLPAWNATRISVRAVLAHE